MNGIYAKFNNKGILMPLYAAKNLIGVIPRLINNNGLNNLCISICLISNQFYNISINTHISKFIVYNCL